MENHWGFSIIVVMDLLAGTASAPSAFALWPHLASLRLLALNLYGWKLPHHWCPPTNGSRPQPLILLSASCCCHTVFGAKLKKPRAPPPARTENYYLLDLWFVHSPVSNAEFGICCPRHRCHPFGAAHPWDKNVGAKWRTMFLQEPVPHAPNTMVHSVAPMLWTKIRRLWYHQPPMLRTPALLDTVGKLQLTPLVFQVSSLQNPPRFCPPGPRGSPEHAPRTAPVLLLRPFFFQTFTFKISKCHCSFP